MQRYFINENLTNKNTFIFSADDLHHLKTVMRSKKGDKIVCIDINGQMYLCKIDDIDQGIISIIEKTDENNELDVEVTLIYALPKGDKFELVLQKATELGVTRIVPLLTRRCVVKSDKKKFAKKLIRYEKILKEAAQQSRRNKIPEIINVIELNELEEYLGRYNLVAYEEISKAGKHKALKQFLDKLETDDKISVIVGSEGGFDQDEIEIMESMGVTPCSLGKRILRSETAPLYLLSTIGYVREIGK
ncbi:MAG: RsmE family RNA methyltransferase [Thomasclavelia sp.]|uniref:RsmE family RNA methyltransferase n=1 Tax=Thomasclavelia sp. TaxID=3025757 RepID=UPI0039A28B29